MTDFFTSKTKTTMLLFHSVPSVIRRLVIIVMNRLIRTACRRLIQIIPQVNIQLLFRTDIPSGAVRPRDAGNTPGQAIALPRKRTVSVLRSREGHGQGVVVDVAGLAHDGVQQLGRRAGRGHELHQLAVDDLELARARVVAQQRGAG